MAHGSLLSNAPMSQSDQDQYKGARDLFSSASQYNAMLFLVNQILDGRNTMAVVKIIKVTNAGELAAVGYVDVQPQVNQLDGYGNAVAHGVIHNIPYFRLQGGANAIILDPQVGDLGMCVFADRDISAVKASKAAANPGSARRADMADGLYVGGFLNGVPSQYVRFSASGIKLCSPTAIILDAPAITLEAETVVINSETVAVNASESMTITAPNTTIDSDMVSVSGSLTVGAGATGSFTTPTGATVTVESGIVVNIF
jgi:hypothetical protein